MGGCRSRESSTRHIQFLRARPTPGDQKGQEETRGNQGGRGEPRNLGMGSAELQENTGVTWFGQAGDPSRQSQIWQPHFTGAPGAAWPKGPAQLAHEVTPPNLSFQQPPEPLPPHHPCPRQTGTHLTGNTSSWREEAPGRSLPASPCSEHAVHLLYPHSPCPATHHEEPQHARTPGAPTGTVTPTQQHPGWAVRRDHHPYPVLGLQVWQGSSTWSILV